MVFSGAGWYLVVHLVYSRSLPLFVVRDKRQEISSLSMVNLRLSLTAMNTAHIVLFSVLYTASGSRPLTWNPLKPVDGILSHMTLLGNSLDTSSLLRNRYSPLAATIKLAQKYLARGVKAH
jgi:hypothetical protein